MNKLMVFIEAQGDDFHHPKAIHRWHWTYAHGDFEDDFSYDIVLFNKPEPTYAGYFLATAENGRTVLINLVKSSFGRLKGVVVI